MTKNNKIWIKEFSEWFLEVLEENHFYKNNDVSHKGLNFYKKKGVYSTLISVDETYRQAGLEIVSWFLSLLVRAENKKQRHFEKCNAAFIKNIGNQKNNIATKKQYYYVKQQCYGYTNKDCFGRIYSSNLLPKDLVYILYHLAQKQTISENLYELKIKKPIQSTLLAYAEKYSLLKKDSLLRKYVHENWWLESEVNYNMENVNPCFYQKNFPEMHQKCSDLNVLAGMIINPDKIDVHYVPDDTEDEPNNIPVRLPDFLERVFNHYALKTYDDDLKPKTSKFLVEIGLDPFLETYCSEIAEIRRHMYQNPDFKYLKSFIIKKEPNLLKQYSKLQHSIQNSIESENLLNLIDYFKILMNFKEKESFDLKILLYNGLMFSADKKSLEYYVKKAIETRASERSTSEHIKFQLTEVEPDSPFLTQIDLLKVKEKFLEHEYGLKI